MNNPGLPMDGDLRVTCQTDIRFLPCQMFLLPRAMGQMTSSALQGLEWFMYVFLFRDFLLYLGMALQTELSGLLMLHKGMLRGMGGMAAQTGSLFKRRMPLPAHRRFLVQIHMTGQAQLPAVCRFDQKGLLAALMGVVTSAAFPCGKRPVQTETGELVINLRMTSDTDLAVALDEQPLFLGLVGGVTGRAFILCRRGMTALPPAVLLPAVALCAQISRFRLESGIFTYAVSGMTGQTITFFYRGMHTLRLIALPLRMAFQTQGCRGHNQHGRLFTGMNAVALRALAFLHRLVLPSEGGLILFMTLDTEQIGLLRGLDKIRPGPIVATAALTGDNRLMDYGFQQPLGVAGMRVMAIQALPLQDIALVRFAHGFLSAFMALEAEAVRLLHQQTGLFALVGSMTGNATLAKGGMNIFFLEMRAFMTSVTKLFLVLQQQPGIGGVMACMAGGTVPLFYRLMAGNRARFRRQILMAAQTQFRLLLPQKRAADYAMGQMACIAIFLPDRRMDNPLLELCHHLGMAIHARFPDLLGRRFPHAGNQQQHPRNNTEQPTCF